MASWGFIPQERNGDALGELTLLDGVALKFGLNRPPTMQAALAMSHPSARRDWLTPGVTELKAYRNGEALESVFACTGAQITSLPVPRLGLSWVGIASYLQDALVLGQASAYSGTTLPWTWINTYQGRTGAVSGITQGTTTGTATSQSRTIENDDELAASIIALSEYQSGFDWAINPNRQLDLWYPTRGSDNGLVLEWGVNVRDFGYEEDAGPGKLVSDARVRGGIDTGAAQVAANTTSRDLYGRREASIVAAGEIDVSGAYLMERAEAIVDERGFPLIIPNVRLDQNHQSVQWGAYWIGDTVTFRARLESYVNIDAQYRIMGINVSLDSAHNEAITLDLNLVAS